MNENLLLHLEAAVSRPINFFPLIIDCKELPLQDMPRPLSDHYLLPQTGKLTAEKTFATIRLGWSEEGIAADVQVQAKPEHTLFPEIYLADGIELLFDTRDRKTGGFNTRFCHHFGFVPIEAGGMTACELTRFRTDDRHEHCNPQDLRTQAKIGSKSYQIQLFIPAHCLHGYDPRQFDKLGFTCRINRSEGPPQHFHTVSKEFSVDQHPAQWATLRLVA